MIKRSKEEWFSLFESQELSGQSAMVFCRERGLCNKHFSLRKKQLGWQVEETVTRTTTGVKRQRFVPVQLNNSVSKPAGDLIHVDYQGISVRMPSTIDSVWLVSVLKGLL